MGLFNNQEIAERLKEYRQVKQRSSSRKFALTAGIDPSQYAKLEAGKLDISQTLVARLTAAYPDLTKDFILYGSTQTAGLPLPQGSNPESFIEVAHTILQMMPQVKGGMPPDDLAAVYMQREKQYEMAINVLLAGYKFLSGPGAKPGAENTDG